MSRAKSANNQNNSSDKELTFEQSLAALEDAVRRLEDGELDLANALGAFESGIRHLKVCYARLEEAERRIDLLCGVDRQGQARVTALPDEGMSLEEKQQSRSRRRTHASSSPPQLDNVDGDGCLF
jgi:exodeoxyribonuclease VII small subunit